MLKPIDNLFHFTKNMDVVIDVFKNGFKPSYANEGLAGRNIKVAMVSFSNILLRDVGEKEVLSYGDFALCLTREWGIRNNVNPVLYTYPDGNLETSIRTLIENSLFLKHVTNFKDLIQKYCGGQKGQPISKLMKLDGTSQEVNDMLDYLSVKYDENLIHIVSRLSSKTNDTNFKIVQLTKSYKVKAKDGKEYIAYNDREWRKVYDDLPFIMEGSQEYDNWEKTPKPHFDKDPYLLKFDISDVRAVMVNDDGEIPKMISFLKGQFGEAVIELGLATGTLIIGTQEILVKNYF